MENAHGMNDVVLRLSEVRLTRGDRPLLAGVTFSARRGELVALMGPSGAGKTTILRVIAGLEPFQAGTVQIEELAFDAPGVDRALRHKVGMVFQFHHLFEHLTVIQNVCLAPVHACGLPRREAERRGRELLAALGVEHRAAALPRELSGGEAQRVAIARALAVNPALLLMDEPTASLDPARRAELRDLLRGLIRENRTLVVATHDEEFARGAATRVLRMREGTLCEES